MVRRNRLTIVVAVLITALTLTVEAFAQITTGSVGGTVKDPQGGVIPGAPVTLVSETRGTQLSDVFTNTAGDFSFVNVPPDRYSVQVNMTGFKTSRRPAWSSPPGTELYLACSRLKSAASRKRFRW